VYDARINHVFGTSRVGDQRRERLGDDVADTNRCREVEDEISVTNETAHHCFVEDCVVHELDVFLSCGKVRDVPSREVVEHRDTMTQADQTVDEVRTDVSRTSGHQRAHVV